MHDRVFSLSLFRPSTIDSRPLTFKRHHHLANVFPLRHIAERINRLLRVEPREEQRLIRTVFELLHHLREQCPNVIGPLSQHAIQVDRKIGKIILERQQPAHAVLLDIRLPDLQEPPIRTQDG